MGTNKISARSTMDTLKLLQEKNPGAQITEHKIRAVIRRGVLRPSLTLGGAYLWQDADVRALATALGVPAPDMGTR